MGKITVQTLVDYFQLEVIAGEKGLNTLVESDDIHRPGLEFTGYLEHFANERIQVLGNTEIFYLLGLPQKERTLRIGNVVSQHPPCFIITRGLEQLTYFTMHCEKYNIPLLRTNLKTTSFISKLNNFLERALAKETSTHGVCLNVFGVGILLRGKSSVGKSEAALSLVERGHRLISDDIVVIKRIAPDTLIGTHNENNREMLALRGIGFIDVARLYGSGSHQEETKLDLDVLITPWEEYNDDDLFGSSRADVEYLDVKVPHIEIPVRPGRDIASLIEVACKNWRLKRTGYDALKVFETRVKEKQNDNI